MPWAPVGQKLKLLDQVREAIRIQPFSVRTDGAFGSWINRFVPLHGKRHPLDLGEDAITRFLSVLAVHEDVSASTQNQALRAVLFLYRHILGLNSG